MTAPYMAWGTQSITPAWWNPNVSLYWGPTEEPFTEGNSGSAVMHPPENLGDQGNGAVSRLVAPPGSVAKMIAYTTRIGGTRSEVSVIEGVVGGDGYIDGAGLGAF